MVIGGGRRAHKGELKKVWRRSRLHMYLDSRGVSCMRITQGYSAPPTLHIPALNALHKQRFNSQHSGNFSLYTYLRFKRGTSKAQLQGGLNPTGYSALASSVASSVVSSVVSSSAAAVVEMAAGAGVSLTSGVLVSSSFFSASSSFSSSFLALAMFCDMSAAFPHEFELDAQTSLVTFSWFS